MTTVTLDPAQLELLRRNAMTQAATDLRHLADQLATLAERGPWPEHPLNADVHNTRALVDESLGTLDALGWPPVEGEA